MSGSILNLSDVVYLANSLGECTFNGTIELADQHFSKVPYNQGPGLLLHYIVEHDDEVLGLSVLEVCHQDEFWGDEVDFVSQQSANIFCENAVRAMLEQKPDGVQLGMDEGEMPGRLVVWAAFKLDKVQDSQEYIRLMEQVFGGIAHQEGLVELAV